MQTRVIKTLFTRFGSNESGATAIEYGLIAAGIAIMVVTGARATGTNLNGLFTVVADTVVPGGPPGAPPGTLPGTNPGTNSGSNNS